MPRLQGTVSTDTELESMKWGDIGLRSIRSGCRPIQDATYQREGKGEAAMIGHQ